MCEPCEHGIDPYRPCSECGRTYESIQEMLINRIRELEAEVQRLRGVLELIDSGDSARWVKWCDENKANIDGRAFPLIIARTALTPEEKG